jgi:SAM-dependent methyltransferase
MDWKTLASECGAYSVIDSRHSPEEFKYVTRRQKEILFPMLKRLLVGNEQTILDFGCGPGRFTCDLAELISGKAVGCDVTRRLLELAPEHPSVKYVHLTETSQRKNWAFDVAWVTAVLCHIPEGRLAQVVADLTDGLRENGLLFLAEPTGEFFIGGPCAIRTRAQIRALFPSIRLEQVGTYYDADQEFSVLAGRKALLTSNSKS